MNAFHLTFYEAEGFCCQQTLVIRDRLAMGMLAAVVVAVVLVDYGFVGLTEYDLKWKNMMMSLSCDYDCG